MYRRVLAALDGSPSSGLALRHAIETARLHGARLRLVHVVDELGFNVGHPRTPQEFWKAVRRAGKLILENGRERAAQEGIEAETKLLEIRTVGALVRHVPEVIANEAARWKADLLVIGTHGRRGLNRLLLGSVATGVVRAASVPVLLVRGPARRTR